LCVERPRGGATTGKRRDLKVAGQGRRVVAKWSDKGGGVVVGMEMLVLVDGRIGERGEEETEW